MESLSVVTPCPFRTSLGMIWMLAGISASLGPVLPSPTTCCNGGPELLLFGPLPSSATLAVGAGGFGGWFACAVRRFAAVTAVDACFGVGLTVGRIRGASTFTGGRA